MANVIKKATEALSRFSFANALTWFEARRGQNPGGLYRKSDYGVWAESINPLRGLTAARAADVFDRARRGVYAELAWIYQEIEAADPTLLICTERRESVIEAAEWRIVKCNPERTTGWDDALADEQQSYLSYAFGAAGDEIGALAAHLERGFFRGFAHARPVYEGETVAGFEALDQWNFARDPSTGLWWWNPDASYSANDRFTQIPLGELITVERSRHIDYPALLIFIRAALGEKKYGVWLERYGIPPATVIMPEFADKGEEASYMEAAQKIAKAGSGALPFGTQVSYANEARGVNPFEAFLRHQQELTVMMATGGILTTLAAPDSGALAGGAHEATWRTITGRDACVTARAVNRTVTRRLLGAKWPGRPMLAKLEFSADKKQTPKDVFADAASAKQGGYLIAQADLEEKSGYKLVLDVPNIPAWHGVDAAPALNKLSTVAKPLQTARVAPGASATGEGASEQTPPENAKKTAIPAKRPDPVAEALKAIEDGADTEAALDAFDRAAKEALAPEAVAARAEQIAEELEAAAAAGKAGE